MPAETSYADRALTRLLGDDGTNVGRLSVGAWTSFTSTASPASGSITSQSSASSYLQIGKIVFCSIHITITSVGTGAGTVTITLPVQPVRAGDFLPGRERGMTGVMISAVFSGAGNSNALLFDYQNANVNLSTGSIYDLTGTYEAG